MWELVTEFDLWKTGFSSKPRSPSFPPRCPVFERWETKQFRDCRLILRAQRPLFWEVQEQNCSLKHQEAKTSHWAPQAALITSLSLFGKSNAHPFRFFTQAPCYFCLIDLCFSNSREVRNCSVRSPVSETAIQINLMSKHHVQKYKGKEFLLWLSGNKPN